MAHHAVRAEIQDEYEEDIRRFASDQNMLDRVCLCNPGVGDVTGGEVVAAEVLDGNVLEVRPEVERRRFVLSTATGREPMVAWYSSAVRSRTSGVCGMASEGVGGPTYHGIVLATEGSALMKMSLI
jgi:hypothetical protein